MLDILKRWLPIAAVAAILCMLVYVAVQQSLRRGANDPQIQMAEDAASAAASGTSPDALLPSSRVDMGRSLAPFLIFYDDAGKAVASSASLHGRTPVPPAGVFDYVRQHGQERVTWQPERGVRIASVILRVATGAEGSGGPRPAFVLAGRSLREVESGEENLMFEAGACLLVSLVVSLALVALKTINKSNASAQKSV